MKEQRKIGEIFIARLNYLFRERGAYFVIGKNFVWVELHLINIINQNIEIGYSNEYIHGKKVELFSPFYFKKVEERKRRFMPLPRMAVSSKGDVSDLKL